MANVSKVNNNYLFKENIFMRSDIYESGNKYFIDIDLPGLKKEDIKVNYSNGYITVNVTKRENKNIVGKYLHKERFVGKIKRSFYIGKKNENDIKVNYNDGILNIAFPIKD